MRRREVLAAVAGTAAAATAGCTIRTTRESDRQGGRTVATRPVVDGLDFPTAMAFLTEEVALLCERDGRVLRYTAANGLDGDPLLDLRDDVVGTIGEMGLLGVTPHPAVASNGRVFLRYSGAAPAEGVYSHAEVLLEVTLGTAFESVTAGSRRTLLEVPQPGQVHNAGDLAFGPEGYLYVPLGDGRRTDIGEGGWSWWYEQGQAAQDIEGNLLGGVLRLDVDTPDGYAVPPDNPLVGEAGRDEYFAWGLRNPYRISFDGDRLLVADVGEHTREMVYVAEAGDNFGWPVLEGSSCSPPAPVGHLIDENPLNVANPKAWLSQINRVSPYNLCPTTDTDAAAFTDPVVEYEREGARAITGGYVYRGDAMPALQGRYLFGDYIQPAPLFAARDRGDETPWPIEELTVADTDHGRLDAALVSFARDPSGEVYVLTTAFGDGSGRVSRLESAD